MLVEVQNVWQRNVSLLQEEMSGMFRSVLLDLPVPDDMRRSWMQALHELRPDVDMQMWSGFMSWVLNYLRRVHGCSLRWLQAGLS
ncbi:hypothetical protein DIPPA_16551 [Diplonema papillatum]|nr:hypothetical protein DIPPA_16547 [Diplonema papillatum]KAJ9441463.1 hypothetical protein DIPPA_16551 [Diplonema papillatum]